MVFHVSETYELWYMDEWQLALKTNFWIGNKERNFRKEIINYLRNVVKHEKYSPANFGKFVHICILRARICN